MIPIKIKEITKSKFKNYFFEMNRQLEELDKEPVSDDQITKHDYFSTLYSHPDFDLFVQKNEKGELEELLLAQEEDFLYIQKTNSTKPPAHLESDIKENPLLQQISNKLKEKLGSYQRVEKSIVEYINLN